MATVTEREIMLRHLAEQEERIAHQDIRIERLRTSGRPFETSINLQTELRNTLERMRVKLAQFSN